VDRRRALVATGYAAAGRTGLPRLAPLAAVLLFLAAIVAAFGYLRLEEMDREQEAVQRDVEYIAATASAAPAGAGSS